MNISLLINNHKFQIKSKPIQQIKNKYEKNKRVETNNKHEKIDN